MVHDLQVRLDRAQTVYGEIPAGPLQVRAAAAWRHLERRLERAARRGVVVEGAGQARPGQIEFDQVGLVRPDRGLGRRALLHLHQVMGDGGLGLGGGGGHALLAGGGGQMSQRHRWGRPEMKCGNPVAARPAEAKSQ